jgi:hypothetical protein
MLLQTGRLSWGERTHLSLERKPYVLEAGEPSTLFPVRIGFISTRNTYCNLGVSSWRLALSAPNSHVHLSLRNLCISQRKMIYFQSFKSSTLLPCEYWVSLWNEYIVPIRIFKLQKGSFFPKRPIRLSWGKTYISPNTIYASSCTYKHIVSLWELS